MTLKEDKCSDTKIARIHVAMCCNRDRPIVLGGTDDRTIHDIAFWDHCTNVVPLNHWNALYAVKKGIGSNEAWKAHCQNFSKKDTLEFMKINKEARNLKTQRTQMKSPALHVFY